MINSAEHPSRDEEIATQPKAKVASKPTILGNIGGLIWDLFTPHDILLLEREREP